MGNRRYCSVLEVVDERCRSARRVESHTRAAQDHGTLKLESQTGENRAGFVVEATRAIGQRGVDARRF